MVRTDELRRRLHVAFAILTILACACFTSAGGVSATRDVATGMSAASHHDTEAAAPAGPRSHLGRVAVDPALDLELAPSDADNEEPPGDGEARLITTDAPAEPAGCLRMAWSEATRDHARRHLLTAPSRGPPA